MLASIAAVVPVLVMRRVCLSDWQCVHSASCEKESLVLAECSRLTICSKHEQACLGLSAKHVFAVFSTQSAYCLSLCQYVDGLVATRQQNTTGSRVGDHHGVTLHVKWNIFKYKVSLIK